MSFFHGVQVVEVNSGSRPIESIATNTIALIGTAPNADSDVFPLGESVVVQNPTAIDALYGHSESADKAGTLPDAIRGVYDQANASVVVIRVKDEGDKTLGHCVDAVPHLMAVESLHGVKPKIIGVPYYSGLVNQASPEDKNPVAAAMESAVERLRGIAVIDGPNTNNSDAIREASKYGNARFYFVDPAIKNLEGNIVSSVSRVAGVIAKTDDEIGFWASPSNKRINGIIGTARAVDFELGHGNNSAALLNANNVSTIVRQNGFRLWGNRSVSDDPKWEFLSVRRTADAINDALQRAHLWAVDAGITKNYFEDVVESVNAYLRDLKAQGAILGGRCWASQDLNSPSQIMQGKAFFDFDFTAVYPAESITFRSHLTDHYLTELVA